MEEQKSSNKTNSNLESSMPWDARFAKIQLFFRWLEHGLLCRYFRWDFNQTKINVNGNRLFYFMHLQRLFDYKINCHAELHWNEKILAYIDDNECNLTNLLINQWYAVVIECLIFAIKR